MFVQGNPVEFMMQDSLDGYFCIKICIREGILSEFFMVVRGVYVELYLIGNLIYFSYRYLLKILN